MTIDHDRFAEANQPPPERDTETPEASTMATQDSEHDPDLRIAAQAAALVRAGTIGLVGAEDVDLSAVEATVATALSEALETFNQFTPLGFTVEWRADRSRALDDLGTLFGVMRIEPRRAK